MFKLNNNADVNGTSLIGHVILNYQSIVKHFGPPIESDEYKVSGEWVFEDDKGNVFTLYDWKSTDLYDTGLPTVSQFRLQDSAEFNIGGHYNNKKDAELFIRWIQFVISK